MKLQQPHTGQDDKRTNIAERTIVTRFVVFRHYKYYQVNYIYILYYIYINIYYIYI